MCGVECMGPKSSCIQPRAAAAMIKRFLKDTFWGRLDIMFFDTPPGTSDEHLSGRCRDPLPHTRHLPVVSSPFYMSLALVFFNISSTLDSAIKVGPTPYCCSGQAAEDSTTQRRHYHHNSTTGQLYPPTTLFSLETGQNSCSRLLSASRSWPLILYSARLLSAARWELKFSAWLRT